MAHDGDIFDGRLEKAPKVQGGEGRGNKDVSRLSRCIACAMCTSACFMPPKASAGWTGCSIHQQTTELASNADPWNDLMHAKHFRLPTHLLLATYYLYQSKSIAGLFSINIMDSAVQTYHVLSCIGKSPYEIGKDAVRVGGENTDSLVTGVGMGVIGLGALAGIGSGSRSYFVCVSMMLFV